MRETAKILSFVLAVFLFPRMSFADLVYNGQVDTLVSQTDYSVYNQSYAGFNTQIQTLGNGLVGRPSSVILKMDRYTLVTTGTAYLTIGEFENSSYSGALRSLTSATTTVAYGIHDQYFDFSSTTFQFDPSKYYSLNLYYGGSSGNARIYGSATNLYANGTSTCTYCSINSVNDLAFNVLVVNSGALYSPDVQFFTNSTSTDPYSICNTGSDFADSFCSVGVFLLVPSPQTLTQVYYDVCVQTL